MPSDAVWDDPAGLVPAMDPTDDPNFGSAPWASQTGEQGDRGTVIAVVAAKGGVGKSSLSLYIAQGLYDAKKKVAVVDANIGQPDIGRTLRIHDKTPGLSALVGGQRFTDKELEEATHFVHQVGDVLVGPPQPVEVNPEPAVRALKLAIERLAVTHEFVVVDSPVATVFEPVLTNAVIPAADVFVVVTNPHDITLHDTAAWLAEAVRPSVRGGQGLPKDRCVGIMNKADDTTGRNADQAQQWLDLPFVAEMPLVPTLVGTINRGEWRCPPEAREALAKLLSDVCSVNVTVSAPEERKSPFGSFLGKRRKAKKG